MSIEAMKMALEALETLDSGDSYKTHTAATALRKAIREAEKEQADFQGFVANVQDAEKQACEIINREWVGLTMEDVAELWEDYDESSWYAFFRAIEAKLREKNAYGWQSVDNVTEYLDELRGGRDDGTNKNICGND